MKINPAIRVVVLFTVFFTLFLSWITLVNDLASLSRDINKVEIQKNKKIVEEKNHYNESIKEMNDKITFYSNEEGFVKINSASTVKPKDILYLSVDSSGNSLSGAGQSVVPR